MIQYKKILMTLALLLTAVTGAWADETPLVTITIGSDGNPVYSVEGLVTLTGTGYTTGGTGQYYWQSPSYEATISATVAAAADNVSITKVVFWSYDGGYEYPLEDTAAPYVCYANASSYGKSLSDNFATTVDGITIAKVEVYGTAETPIEVTPVAEPAANTKQWTFAMPGSNVVLTPIYAAATIYGTDGQTEKMAYETLKEAIQNVQNGETIKLDWDVTFTAQDDPIETNKEGEGVTFTLDLNGYTIDGTALENPCIVLYNANDQMTITDSKLTDGIKGIPATGAGAIIFDGGRYFLGTEVNAEYLKTNWANYASVGWQLADGKEFVDIENAPDADGFMFRVDYAAFELTIGAGRFATFYMDQNVTLAEGQNIGFYTISNISDDRTKANVTPINSTIIPANTPTLVYNSGNDQQTVKLKVTTDAVNLTVDYVEQFKGTAKKHEFTADDMDAADYYALSGGKAFAPVKGAGTLGANQCWLQFNHANGAPARGITLVFDNETTGVNEVIEVNEVSDDTLYDLNGRKVNAPTKKGVYIQDGRKVVK